MLGRDRFGIQFVNKLQCFHLGATGHKDGEWQESKTHFVFGRFKPFARQLGMGSQNQEGFAKHGTFFSFAQEIFPKDFLQRFASILKDELIRAGTGGSSPYQRVALKQRCHFCDGMVVGCCFVVCCCCCWPIEDTEGDSGCWLLLTNRDYRRYLKMKLTVDSTPLLAPVVILEVVLTAAVGQKLDDCHLLLPNFRRLRTVSAS